MNYAATEGNAAVAIETIEDQVCGQDIVEFDHDYRDRDSLSENFVNEIEAWARQALAANGFGDF